MMLSTETKIAFFEYSAACSAYADYLCVLAVSSEAADPVKGKQLVSNVTNSLSQLRETTGLDIDTVVKLFKQGLN